MEGDLGTWFAERVPEGWFVGSPDVVVDRDEILIVGELPREGSSTRASEQAAVAAIDAFREDTREARIRIAREAEYRFRRKVAWGARCGAVEKIFTSLSIPVMTRLRMPERRLLDTLVESGVARSRSEALKWCVRLVAKNEAGWIGELSRALVHVREVRADGPDIG